MLQNLTFILLILLIVPLLCKWLRLPSIVGYILAGIAVGSHGLGWVEYSTTVQVIGKAGMIYLMFLSGIEIDLGDFKRSRGKSFLFGLLTFLIPCTLGILTSRLLGFSWLPSVLLGSMYGSQTLMTYPIVSRYGLQRQNVVSVVVGGTMFAITLSLLSLGAISSMWQGEGGITAVLRLGSYVVLFLILVVWIFPILATWFIKRYNDPAAEFLLVLVLVGIAAWIADAAGLEAILGAFIAGVALNRRIPNLSPLMNRITFVGNTFFIPVFLLGVGMMIDIEVFTSGWFTLLVAGVMLVTKLCGKWLASLFTQLALRWKRDERVLTFGLSSASAAGTLAIVTIGYDLGILPAEILNASVLLILFSCLIASFVTEIGSKNIALKEMFTEENEDTPKRVLIALGNPQTDTNLVDIALLTSAKKSEGEFAAVSVIHNMDEELQAQDTVRHAAKYASAVDCDLHMLTQVAANTANGIMLIKQRQGFTKLVLGFNLNEETSLGEVAEHLISAVTEQMMLYRQVQPLNTIERLRVAIPKHATQESGFLQAFENIRNLAIQTSARVTFYSNSETEQALRQLCTREKKRLTAEFVEMEDWEDSLMIAKEMEENDMLILLLARPTTVSYNPLFDSTPYLLHKFYQQHNVLIIYPEQTGATQGESITQGSYSTTERTPMTRRLYNRWLRWHRRNQKYLG